ncbi:hypothetical protein TNCT_477551 [Trichonephila clavata]|uniref:Uncharacterized protein n=1 Tax=Trichonephila clavata TaxID=2740835 RepID=A0A8X6F2Q6_TRICU|nr:hypothetical protein TNCT_477551 [Trichonephila clavata]
MSTMDVDPPDRQNPCSRRLDLMTSIKSEDILISNFSDIINVPDTDQNIHMKEIVRKQIKEHQQGKDAALTELESLTPCITSDCSDCRVRQINISKTPSPLPEEPKTLINNPPIITKNSKSVEDNPLPKRKPKKKRKKPKDSTDDFVFPKKTATPASPTPSEPITTANSFSDLESDIEEQTQPEQIPQEP